MFSYCAYGVGIHSMLALPELVPCEVDADVFVRLRGVMATSAAAGSAKDIQAGSQEVLLSWESVGTFLVRGGHEIIVAPDADVEETVLRLFILGPALGVLLHQRGLLVLHGSGVSLNHQGIAFVGAKGSGKSSTAATLQARGHSVVADDVLALKANLMGDTVVLPGVPQLKLWPDAITLLGENPGRLPRIHPQLDKRACKLSNGFSQTPLPLRCIYVLDSGLDFEVNALHPQEAFMELVRHSYALRFLGSPGVTPEHFRQCASIARCVPLYRLKRLGTLSALPETARLVEEHLVLNQLEVDG